MGPDFPYEKEVLEPYMGNICSLVKNATQIHTSPELVEIVWEVSHFLYLTVPSTKLSYDVTADQACSISKTRGMRAQYI